MVILSTTINLTIFIILLILTAFFVSTEFAIVKVRQSRIDQLVAEGRSGAEATKYVISHLDEYLSACQLGITVTALGIGMVGESTFEFILDPLFTSIGIPTTYLHYFTVGAAFIIATFLHVVVGELAPKTIAIQKADSVALAFSKPIMIFYKILFPFIWLLNGSARHLVRLFGFEQVHESELSHTEEELRIIITESFKSGEINKNELKYVTNVFEFDDTIAKEIMVPRTEIVGFDINTTLEEVMETIARERYTRYPIFEGDRDNILGFLNIKDLIVVGMNNRVTKDNFVLLNFLNPVVYSIETTPIQELLQKMQKERIHITILFDEYGGTSGMVTVEDIIEELVGEIQDEFDDDEIPAIQKIGNCHFIIASTVLITELEKLLSISFDVENVDTIGGWYYIQNIDLDPHLEVTFDQFSFKIKEKEGHQLHYLEVKKMT